MKQRIANILMLIVALAGASHVFAQVNLEINTPGITAIQGSMQKRHAELAPLYASGAVGLTRDGNVALRDPAGIKLQKLVEFAAVEEHQPRPPPELRERYELSHWPTWAPPGFATIPWTIEDFRARVYSGRDRDEPISRFALAPVAAYVSQRIATLPPAMRAA